MQTGAPTRGRRSSMWQAMAHFNEVRTAARKPLLEQWPELQQRDRRGYAAIRAKVIAALERRDRSGQLRDCAGVDVGVGVDVVAAGPVGAVTMTGTVLTTQPESD